MYRRQLCRITVATVALMAAPLIALGESVWTVQSGETEVFINARLLQEHGISVQIDGVAQDMAGSLVLPVAADSSFNFTLDDSGAILGHNAGSVKHGAQVRLRSSNVGVALAAFSVQVGPKAQLSFMEMPPSPDSGVSVSNGLLQVHNLKVAFDSAAQVLMLEAGDLVITPELADRLNAPALAGETLGTFQMQAAAEWTAGDAPKDDGPIQPIGGNDGTVCGQAVGPDVIVGVLPDRSNNGCIGSICAFSIGTTSCNIGNANLLWIAGNNQHPVIGANMYRYLDGRFQQVGMSWLKHGFTALTQNACGCGCSGPGGTVLGVGCSDPYCSFLNGSQGGLGPRSEVNAYTGVFSYPFGTQGQTGNSIYKRLQVPVTYFQEGGTYFVEGQYITQDDAQSGNGDNNCSYRPISVSGGGSSFSINLTGSTIREKPAIYAWQGIDSSVGIEKVGIPNEGTLFLGSRATDIGGGQYRYEYGIQNMNSDRSVGSFSVPINSGVVVTNWGFHDVSYHSGEPYDGTDWTATVSANAITWSTVDFGTNPNANAIRWGTLYNFWFEANSPEGDQESTVGLFKPGAPDSVGVKVAVPLPIAVSALITGGSSCMEHGASGEMCLNMLMDGIEPRTPGVSKVVLLMDSVVSTVGASVSCLQAYGGTVNASVIGLGNEVQVDFDPALPDHDCCTITLSGDSTDSYTVRPLAGDLDLNEAVNTADITSLKPFLGMVTDSANFGADIDANGNINTADITAIKPLLGNLAACAP